jgi:hypothetical protein
MTRIRTLVSDPDYIKARGHLDEAARLTSEHVQSPWYKAAIAITTILAERVLKQTAGETLDDLYQLARDHDTPDLLAVIDEIRLGDTNFALCQFQRAIIAAHARGQGNKGHADIRIAERDERWKAVLDRLPDLIYTEPIDPEKKVKPL